MKYAELRFQQENEKAGLPCSPLAGNQLRVVLGQFWARVSHDDFFVNKHGGMIRTWVAITGVLGGGILYKSTSGKQQQALDQLGRAVTSLVTLQDKMTATQTTMTALQDSSLAFTKTSSALLADAYMHMAPNILAARRNLTPTYLPAEDADRRDLLDLCDALVNLVHTKELLGKAFFVEKYGAIIERALANPFIQDQILGNPARWKSLVEVGKYCIPPSSAAIKLSQDAGPFNTIAYDEARHFLDAVAAESPQCHAHMQALIEVKDSDTRTALARSTAVLAAGSVTNGLYLHCAYAQGTLRRLNNAVAAPAESLK